MAIMHSLYREGGSVTINHESCIGCGQCAAICAGEVLKMENGRVRIVDGPFGCIACGHCMMMCPNDCIDVTGRGLSRDDILPMSAPGEKATSEALAALMQARRSVRKFAKKDVALADIDFIIEAASTAPMGIPPWDIGCTAVVGRDKVNQLAGAIIGGYEKFLRLFKPWVLRVMRPFVARATYEAFSGFIRPLALSYVNGWKEGRDLLFYNAPALLIFHHSPYSDAFDAGIACTYAMLAAEARGLGNCMIGGGAPMLQRDPELCRSLGIPEGNKPSIVLIIGHPAVTFRKTIRRRFAHNKKI